jgi:cytidine deaminase
MNYKHEIKYQRFEHLNALSLNDQQLVFVAKSAMQQAYAPYSNFKVGVALSLSDGTIIKGNNQENIAYPSGLCAERVALFYAGANYPEMNIMTMVIVAKGDLLKQEEGISPCGACRQVMLESERRQLNTIRILLIGQKGEVLLFHAASDLLPMAFAK